MPSSSTTTARGNDRRHALHSAIVAAMTTRPSFVDLVSDTATRPTKGMYDAMMTAPLGDEQKGEDPTVRALEERTAKLLGQESALFLPSATMANQIALSLLCGPGDEVICHRSSHVYNYETGGTAMTARAQIAVLDGPKGFFTGDDVLRVVRADDPHLPDTRVVVVEQTSNGGGGTVWPDATFASVVEVCRAHKLALHIDGARLMHAAVARGTAPTTWTAHATTVQMCFSKGLGCPFGAVLALPSSLWRGARRRKQALGGALRQAGVIAGAMLYALDHHVERLADDHRRAQALADGLARLDGLSVEVPETNLVFFSITRPGLTPRALCDKLRQNGVRMAPTIDGRIRACLHLDVDDAGVELSVRAAKSALA
jgi:threonine aldolase